MLLEWSRCRPRLPRNGGRADSRGLMLIRLGACLMEQEPALLIEHPLGQVTQIVGLYQSLLRRYLEHFFPDARLEPAGDRSFIQWEGPATEANYQFADDPEGFGLEIEWFRTRYVFVPDNPAPFLPSERKLVEYIIRVLD